MSLTGHIAGTSGNFWIIMGEGVKVTVWIFLEGFFWKRVRTEEDLLRGEGGSGYADSFEF